MCVLQNNLNLFRFSCMHLLMGMGNRQKYIGSGAVPTFFSIPCKSLQNPALLFINKYTFFYTQKHILEIFCRPAPAKPCNFLHNLVEFIQNKPANHIEFLCLKEEGGKHIFWFLLPPYRVFAGIRRAKLLIRVFSPHFGP